MIKLENIMYVKAVAEFGSVSAAANYLFLSQPYLSSVVSRVEKELDVKLFNRTGKGMELTPAGEQFMHLSEELNSILLEMSKLKYMEKHRKCRVSIFSTPYVSRIANDLAKQYDDLETHLMLSKQAQEEVMNGNCDVAVIYCASNQLRALKSRLRGLNLLYHSIVQEPVFIMVGHDHPLFQKEFVTKEDLKPYPFACEKLFLEDVKKTAADFLEDKVYRPMLFSQTRSMISHIMYSDCFSIGIKGLNQENYQIDRGMIKLIPLLESSVHLEFGYIMPVGFSCPDSLKKFIDMVSDILRS